jgi:hypothetical protein
MNPNQHDSSAIRLGLAKNGAPKTLVWTLHHLGLQSDPKLGGQNEEKSGYKELTDDVYVKLTVT